jgi:iron complex outermembrane receptor protein
MTFHISRLSPVALATLACCSTLAQAQTQTIEITADKERYVSSSSTTGTRISVPLKETPLSISVVNESLIKDKGIQNPNEIADLVPGVQSNAAAWGGGSADFIIRGFASNGINYRDGFRVRNIDVPVDMANVSSVEFVKGPGSVLYGSAEPGGSMNIISKKPLNYDYAYADVTAGSWGQFRTTADVNKVVGDVSARLNVESPRVLRRLHTLRRWSHEQEIKPFFT